MQTLWLLSALSPVFGAPIPQETDLLESDEYSAKTTINFNKPKEVFWHEFKNKFKKT